MIFLFLGLYNIKYIKLSTYKKVILINDVLQSKKETVIGMKIHYSLVGKTTICWELNIGHDRRIMLNVIIDCLTESESQNNFLSSTLVNFGKTYFGNKGAMYRV